MNLLLACVFNHGIISVTYQIFISNNSKISRYLVNFAHLLWAQVGLVSSWEEEGEEEELIGVMRYLLCASKEDLLPQNR